MYMIVKKPQSVKGRGFFLFYFFRFRYLIIAIIRQQNSISGISPKSMISNISVVARAPIYRFTIVIRF